MFMRSLLGLCLLTAFSPVVWAAETPLSEPIVRKYELKHVSATQIAQKLTTPYAAGGLKEFVPAGIQVIVGLVGLNAIVARAADEQALATLAVMVAAIDAPVKRMTIPITVVRLGVEDAKALLDQMKPGILKQASSSARDKPALVMQTSAWEQVITQLTDAKKIMWIRPPHFSHTSLIAGKSTVIDARGWEIPFDAFLLTDLNSQDNTVQGQLEAVLPIPTAAIPKKFPPSYTTALLIKEGETALLYHTDLTGQNKPAVLVFATPSLLKSEPMPQGNMQQLPPLH